jgi:hypothetical protein
LDGWNLSLLSLGWQERFKLLTLRLIWESWWSCWSFSYRCELLLLLLNWESWRSCWSSYYWCVLLLLKLSWERWWRRCV